MERFKDKVAIVLGASDAKSMGGVIARRLTQEGAKVVVAARRPEQVDELARSLGAGGITCDIAVEAQLAALAELAITRFGRLDVAVNCAGEAIMGGIAATEESVLRRATDIHFIGPFLFIKQMAAQMGKGGSIVSISSITASLLFPNHAVDITSSCPFLQQLVSTTEAAASAAPPIQCTYRH